MIGESEDAYWRRHPWLCAGLALALGLAAIFAVRVALTASNWAETAGPPVDGWMTLGFIAQTHDADRDKLAKALGIDLAPEQRITLDVVAEQTGRTPAQVRKIVEHSLAAQAREAKKP